MKAMHVKDLTLTGLKLIQLNAFGDERGFFKEAYNQELYLKNGLPLFVQDNVSFSKKNVLRGMHFQSHPGQDKLVSVLQGEIFDVAVDMRPTSPHFGKWEGVYLKAEDHRQLFIPKGFAHGFCVTCASGALVQYKMSAPYNAKTECAFRFDDPSIGILWPIVSPILSERDLKAPLFNSFFQETCQT